MVDHQGMSVAFKQCPFGTKGLKACQENIPHTITPPPLACTVVTRHDGSMFSCCLRQILTLQHFSSLQLSSFGGQIVPLFPICSGDVVGSSPIVANPPQGCVCCGFTNALLHTS